ncbi:MAG TPA: peptidylprolyl isomerase [Cyclobacteriaceae bacterium]|nr:peptidylprolyl isomerase [Cyclobacteriaceae bacterium]
MKKVKIFLLSLLQFGIFLQACSDDPRKDFLVTIKTNYGEMKAILYDETPKHKENFLKLAREGFYNGLLFHRVMNQFMIQTGDPNSKIAEKGAPLGVGGPGYTIPAEFNPSLIHIKGALAAARQGDNINPKKESSGSQFYIAQGKVFTREELMANRIDINQLNKFFNMYIQTPENKALRDQAIQFQKERNSTALQNLALDRKDELENFYSVDFDISISELQVEKYTTIGGIPHLDGAYTVFGQVIDGLDVIDKIAAVETDARNRPMEDISIEMHVDEMRCRKITKLYGYQYPPMQRKQQE